MSSWITGSACLTVEVDVEQIVNNINPLWVGLAFLFAFLVGCILGGVLGKCCLNWSQEKEQKDAEVATFVAQSIPMHLRGKKKRDIIIAEKTQETLPPGFSREATTISMRPVTPSNISIEDARPGLSDALIRSTGEGAVAEVTSQDYREFSELEITLVNERITGLINYLKVTLFKMVKSDKVVNEEADDLVADLNRKCQEILENCRNEELEELEAIKRKHGNNTVAIQTESDDLHPKTVLKLNKQLGDVETEVSRRLAALGRLSEDEVEAVCAQLTHQLATREKKLGDEADRQLKSLEDKLARRKELIEQNRLRKDAEKNEIEYKVQTFAETMREMLERGKITEQEYSERMAIYERSINRAKSDKNDERDSEEKVLHMKLAKERQAKWKKMAAKHKKELKAYEAEAARMDSIAMAERYHEIIRNQSMEKGQLEQEMDQKEYQEMNSLHTRLNKQFHDAYTEVDNEHYENLQRMSSLDEADVEKIIKLHKAQMKEYNRAQKERENNSEGRLQERLAERKARREAKSRGPSDARRPSAGSQRQSASPQVDDEPLTNDRAYVAMVSQQEETIKTVIQNQSDLTEEAVQRIMEEHARNVNSLNTQLNISKNRQQRQLENRLAQRKANIAEKKEKQIELKISGGKDNQKEAAKMHNEIEAEILEMAQEHDSSIKALRLRLLAETREALKAQEEQLTALIGQLEVGRARRQNILRKQDKLIAELENQLANKVSDNPKGFNTTNELMQRHYGQVDQLMGTLQGEKDRQENALQERLERKRLQREAEVRDDMKEEARKELEKLRARGAGAAAQVMIDMMLQQRHERAMADLEQEMKIDLQRAREEMHERLNSELMATLSDEGKAYMADIAATSGMTNADLMDAMNNAASKIDANDQTVKKLAKELKVRVKTAKGGRSHS